MHVTCGGWSHLGPHLSLNIQDRSLTWLAADAGYRLEAQFREPIEAPWHGLCMWIDFSWLDSWILGECIFGASIVRVRKRRGEASWTTSMETALIFLYCTHQGRHRAKEVGKWTSPFGGGGKRSHYRRVYKIRHYCDFELEPDHLYLTKEIFPLVSQG